MWAGYHSPVRPSNVDRRAVGAIAKPLVHAAADSKAIAEALNAGLGVALPGEAWRNQLELGHEKRTQTFQRLPFAQKRKIDPADRWDPRFIQTYAADQLEAQMTAGATILTTPGHYHQHEGGESRSNDLQLAKAASAEFAARRARNPAKPGWPARSLFASILVESRELAGAIESLISAYAPLDVDGYWIVVANNREARAELEAVATLAFGLEDESGKPCVVSCVGRPHPTLLAYGLAAVCSGHQGGSLVFPPKERNPEDGFGVHVYHPRIRGAATLGEGGDRQLAQLFRRWPCHCGHHPPEAPPTSKAAREAHNQSVLELEAAELCELPVDQRPALVSAWLAGATQARSELGFSSLKPGWHGVSSWHERSSRGNLPLTG